MSTVAAYQQIDTGKHDALIEKHAPLVKKIAHHLAGRLPSSVQLDDLIQAGMMGLMDATRNYDDSKGASFETYAGIRIRGTMLDEVRRNDWLPRSVYRNSRLISAAVKDVENTVGRDAKDTEVAKCLKMDLDEYHRLLRETNSGQLYGYDDIGVTDDVMQCGMHETEFDPLKDVTKEQFNRQLIETIKGLPEREKLILSLYYEEEFNLKEIGEVLGVSESRVCQIHSQAMSRLRSRMPDWQNT